MFEYGSPRIFCAGLVVCACAIISNASGATDDVETTEAVTQKPDPGNVSIVMAGSTIDRILPKLEEQGIKVRARGKTMGQKIPSFIERNVPARKALTDLVESRPDWLLYEPTDQPGTYEIWDQQSYKEEVLPKLVRPKTFLLKNTDAESAYKMIAGYLTPRIGSAAFDPRSNKLFVTDLVPVLERVQKMIDEVDVAFITRVFVISHADVSQLADKLMRLRSPAAPRVEVDERTRQIIVRDRLDIIRKMELLVETLDVQARSAADDTLLAGWKVTRAGADTAKVFANTDLSVGGSKTRSVVLRRGVPERILQRDVESTVTLVRLPDASTSSTGAVAIFRVERAPTEVALRVDEPDAP
jgi:hypothetical protein